MTRASALIALAVAISCSPPPRTTSVPAPLPRATAPLRYDVTVVDGGAQLDVHVELGRGSELDFALEDGGERFVRGLAFDDGRGPRPLKVATAGRDEDGDAIGACVPIPACAGACSLRYRYDLARAASYIDDDSIAAEHDGAFVAPPSTWLLHPETYALGRRFTLDVHAHGAEVVTGLTRDEGGRWLGDLSDLPRAPYGAFGALKVQRWSKDGFTLEIARAPGASDVAHPAGGSATVDDADGRASSVDDAALLRWASEAGDAVLGWAGRAPIARALVLVVPGRGRGVGYARTLGNGGASVLVPLGKDTTPADLVGRWELVHELLHVSFPNLPNEQSWLEEGMATYLEPFVRARAGLTTEAEVWTRLARRLPLGAGKRGDPPLDGATSWARVYWGGAAFCLAADVEIRRRTNGVRSLGDALRAILAAGGNVGQRWSIERVIEVGDAATGVPVLRERHAARGAHEATEDLDVDRLLRDLGVSLRGGELQLTDDAPLAAVRRGILARP